MLYKRIILAALFCFLLPLYSIANKDSIVAIIKSTALSQEKFGSFFRGQNYDSARAARALKSGIYLPEDQNCGGNIPVFPRLTFNRQQIVKSLQQTDVFNALLAYTTVLYKLIPEPFKMNNLLSAPPKVTNYSDHPLNCKSIFDSLSTGAWAFDCGGHALIAKVFLDSMGGKKYISKTVQLSRKNGDEVNHIITLVYYKENNQWYGVALDCQNGKLGPVRNGKDRILSLAEQKKLLELNEAGSLEIVSIADRDLHKKRNLMNEALYCNVLPDSNSVYHLAYQQSGYKYERLTYSALHYVWFKTGLLNMKKYKQNLLALLIKNAPGN
jgi:hypothetical protein